MTRLAQWTEKSLVVQVDLNHQGGLQMCTRVYAAVCKLQRLQALIGEAIETKEP